MPVRARRLADTINEASKALAGQGRAPQPEGLDLHTMRSTFASMQYALGEGSRRGDSQMGLESGRLALAGLSKAAA
jgi:hypothetical protein